MDKQLKAELQSRGLKLSGKKADLVQRLQDAKERVPEQPEPAKVTWEEPGPCALEALFKEVKGSEEIIKQRLLRAKHRRRSS